MKTIAVRVSDEDHKLFHQLADREYMPISALIRRVLMQLAEKRGLRDFDLTPKPVQATTVTTIQRPMPAPIHDIDFDAGLNVEPPDWIACA